MLAGLLACADPDTNPSLELDPGFLAGQGGEAGQSGAAGTAGTAGTAGAGGSGGAAQGGQGGAGKNTAGSASGVGGKGATGGAGGGAGGTAGEAGKAVSFGGGGEGGAGEGGAASQGGVAGQAAGNGPGGSGAGGQPFGGAGAGPFGGAGSGGQPFGGMANTDKICPAPPEGGAAGTGGGKGVAGGFCAAESLGNPNDDPCYTCWNSALAGACKAAADACINSPDCVKFAQCWSSCPRDEDKCFKKCQGEVPAGALPYSDLRNCMYLDACPAVCHEQCEGIGSANRCNHDPCTTGYDLDPDCGDCTAKICDQDSTCCAFEWDGSCAAKAETICKLDCSAAQKGCVHSECATGAPLDPACSPCASQVCAKLPSCCAPYGRWDLACAEEADASCK